MISFLTFNFVNNLNLTFLKLKRRNGLKSKAKILFATFKHVCKI